MKVFLGGTCAETTWRDELIPLLQENSINFFNPVVKDWTPECQAIEEDEKNNKCDVHLYVITKEMMGTYSIAEIINSTWQSILYGTNVKFTLFAVLDENTWQKHERKSFDAIMRLMSDIAPNNSFGLYINNMNELAECLTKLQYKTANKIII